MTNIEIKHLTFGFDNQLEELFDDTTLNFDDHWKLGLIGRNGRGKTTLMRLLLEELSYQGTITHQLDFLYFPQSIPDKSQLTFYALTELADFEQWELEREFNLLKLDPAVLWRPFDSLSGGEQTKALLALLFIDDQHFPLIDEPTNHLDITARQQVSEYLQKKKQGFIVISHDRYFMDTVIDHVLSIEKSQLVLYQGNFSTYEEQKRLRDEFETAQNLKLQKEIGRLKQTAAEKAEWSRSRESDRHKKRTGFIDTEMRRVNKGAVGADAARTMKRSKAIVKRLEGQAGEKAKLLKDIEYIDPLSMAYQPSHHKHFVTVENLVLGYDEPLFKPVSFEINCGDRVAIVGPNGSGKSSLIQFLQGTFTGTTSGIFTQPTLMISSVRQLYEDNTGSLESFAQENQLAYDAFLNNLHKLGMERNVFQNDIQLMSMGQRKKVELAKSLSQPANLYYWDEPLNYLDVFNQKQLEELILETQPTMLLVEHDQAFLDKVATKIIYLEKRL